MWHGIDFAPVSGDPGELMRICIQDGMFTYSFLKEASGKVRIVPANTSYRRLINSSSADGLMTYSSPLGKPVRVQTFSSNHHRQWLAFISQKH